MSHPMHNGDEFSKTVCKALNIDADLARRIIIDFQAGKMPAVYVEMYSDPEILEVNWDEGLTGAEIKGVG